MLFEFCKNKVVKLKKSNINTHYYRAITNILGSIDKRIAKSQELVNKYIQILDYLYDYFFGNKHSIANAKVIDIIQIVSGYPFDSATYSKGKYKIITIKSIQPDKFDTTTADELSEKPIGLNAVYELLYGDILLSLTGDTGRMAIVDEKNTLLNQRVGKLISKEGYKVFSYCLFHNAYIQAIIERNSVGTSQKNVSSLELQQIPIYVPTQVELQKFNLVAVPIFQSLLNELIREKLLTNYKKSILPLLMNGQIKAE